MQIKVFSAVIVSCLITLALAAPLPAPDVEDAALVYNLPILIYGAVLTFSYSRTLARPHRNPIPPADGIVSDTTHSLTPTYPPCLSTPF
ncbi:hypothetical protein F5887DRAFT_965238 [Amanita rubescens]|nr:hypothetical protein F5887DRAFT_965238 [Amanita rubescens]